MSHNENRRCTQRTQSGRPCNAWAVRGSDPPTCAVHARKSHGFYAIALEPRELEDLVARGDDLSLDDEIACARVAVRRVLAALGTPGDETGLSASDFARLAGLAFQGTRTVSRLLRDPLGFASGCSATHSASPRDATRPTRLRLGMLRDPLSFASGCYATHSALPRDAARSARPIG